MVKDRFDVIYSDPPWMETGGGKIKRGADRHYPLMKVEEICRLPVQDWARENSHLYLWVTNNFFPDGFRVMSAWGFRYVTCITWFKGVLVEGEQDVWYDGQVGLGQYFRGCTEHCLFGVKGNLPYRVGLDGKRLQGRTGLFAPRTTHSTKPKEMREMIERVSGFDGCRKLEMFARERWDGWEAWGNEVEEEGLG